ncbi:MAG: hypothetical protein RQ731_08020 [Anaerosomatales bacterium]|nr:hypothetical protein [Anaerosomatales bacterium]
MTLKALVDDLDRFCTDILDEYTALASQTHRLAQRDPLDLHLIALNARACGMLAAAQDVLTHVLGEAEAAQRIRRAQLAHSYDPVQRNRYHVPTDTHLAQREREVLVQPAFLDDIQEAANDQDITDEQLGEFCRYFLGPYEYANETLMEASLDDLPY